MSPPSIAAVHGLKVLLGLSFSLCLALPARAGSRVPPVALYRIEAAWDGGQKTISGRETVTFVNRTSRELPDVLLDLYLNNFRNTLSTLWRGLPPPSGSNAFGFCDLKRVALSDGTDLTRRVSFATSEGGNPDDRMLARVLLPRPVAPGETLVLEVDFESRLPHGRLGTGWKDDFVFAGHWYPRLAKMTETGWRGRPPFASTELFRDFGDYDVTLLLPGEVKGKVAVTGRVVAETVETAGRVRVRALAEDVLDFVFAFCPRFEVRTETVAPKGLPKVDVLLFLQPDHRRSRERILHAAREGLALYGTWLAPYPYQALSIVDPPTGSGVEAMASPTLLTTGTTWLSPACSGEPGTRMLRALAQQWFGGMLASDETSGANFHAGIASWIGARAAMKILGAPCDVVEAFGVPIPLRSLRRPLPEGESQDALDQNIFSSADPTLREGSLCLDDAAVRANAPSRTVLLLESVARTTGEQPLLAALKEYSRRFAFHNPKVSDFLDVLGEVAGRQARDLVERGWASRGAVDYAVTSATSRRAAPPAGYLGEGPHRAYRPPAEPGRTFESTVVVKRLGEVAWPVDIEMRFAGGETVIRRWDSRAEQRCWRITGPRLLSAVVDPRHACLLDVNLFNNGLRTEPDPTTSRAWAHRLRFLAQNLLELFSLVAALPGVSW